MFRRRKQLTVIPTSCNYCPDEARVHMVWPGENEPDILCVSHGRFVREGLGEIVMLSELAAS